MKLIHILLSGVFVSVMLGCNPLVEVDSGTGGESGQMVNNGKPTLIPKKEGDNTGDGNGMVMPELNDEDPPMQAPQQDDPIINGDSDMEDDFPFEPGDSQSGGVEPIDAEDDFPDDDPFGSSGGFDGFEAGPCDDFILCMVEQCPCLLDEQCSAEEFGFCEFDSCPDHAPDHLREHLILLLDCMYDPECDPDEYFPAECI